MPSMLNPACPLCGLRFGNKPLLELHIREDHRQHVARAPDRHLDPGSTRAAAPGADTPRDGQNAASAPSRTSAATATRARRAPGGS